MKLCKRQYFLFYFTSLDFENQSLKLFHKLGFGKYCYIYLGCLCLYNISAVGAPKTAGKEARDLVSCSVLRSDPQPVPSLYSCYSN